MIFGINALSVTSGSGEGAEPYLRELAAHLARVDTGNEYLLFVHAGRGDLRPAGAPHVRAVVCPLAPGSAWRQRVGEQLWLPAAVRRVRIDALLCLSAAIPRLVTSPAVITVHEELSSRPEYWACRGRFLPRWPTRVRRGGNRMALRGVARRAAAVLATSDAIRRDLIRFCAVEPARVVVARPGVASRFRPVQAPERIAAVMERHGLRAPFVLVAGGLSPYKSLDRVLEGLAHVRRCSHRLPMLALMGGDRFGCRPSLERLIDALDLREQVRFLASMPPGDLPALYTAATAYLSLSPGEGAGMPLLAAMACGCPAICARRSARPQQPAGDAALFVAPDRPQEVGEAIWRLTTLPHLRDAWAARALEHAAQFDWHETARITRDTLCAAAEGQAPEPPAQAGPPAPVTAAGESSRPGGPRE